MADNHHWKLLTTPNAPRATLLKNNYCTTNYKYLAPSIFIGMACLQVFGLITALVLNVLQPPSAIFSRSFQIHIMPCNNELTLIEVDRGLCRIRKSAIEDLTLMLNQNHRSLDSGVDVCLPSNPIP